MRVFRPFSLLFILILALSSCNNIKNFSKDREALNQKKAERRAAYREKKAEEKENKLSENTKVIADINTSVNTDDTSVKDKRTDQEGSINYNSLSDSLFISYERTPCFGRCPVYRLEIYNSGYAIYEGLNFVENKGKYQCHISEKDLISLEKHLNDSYFFQFDDVYDNDKLTDLPSKIIEVHKSSISKRIKARYQVPEKLISIFEEIDQIVDSCKWKPLNE